MTDRRGATVIAVIAAAFGRVGCGMLLAPKPFLRSFLWPFPRPSARPSLRAGLAALLLAMASLPLPARADALGDLRAFIAGTQSASGAFSQVVRKATGSNGTEASGTFSYARPARFRWQVRKPYEQLLVSDGRTLWIYDPDLNQVTTRRIDDALGSTPAAILFGGGDLDKSFALSNAGDSDGLHWVEALPRDRDSGFERIGIGMRGGQPEQMEIRDSFGQTTLIRFTKLERGAVVKDGDFHFEPPKGSDVITQ